MPSTDLGLNATKEASCIDNHCDKPEELQAKLAQQNLTQNHA
jgi:hypothetical protein